jgi:antirestriction protein ArdC
MKVAQLYADVTANIIKDLEAGTAPWVKPWKNGNIGGILPSNAVTGRKYLGINIPILWGAQIARGYATAKWMTYKHAQELGGSRPGRAKPGRFAFDD